MDERELMPLDELSNDAWFCDGSHGQDVTLDVADLKKLLDTARAAHEWKETAFRQEKCFNESQKELMEENAKLREDIVKERKIVDSVHLQKDALLRSNYELKEQLRTARREERERIRGLIMNAWREGYLSVKTYTAERQMEMYAEKIMKGEGNGN